MAREEDEPVGPVLTESAKANNGEFAVVEEVKVNDQEAPVVSKKRRNRNKKRVKKTSVTATDARQNDVQRKSSAAEPVNRHLQLLSNQSRSENGLKKEKFSQVVA